MMMLVALDVYDSSSELSRPLAEFVAYYNQQRVHEALHNVTSADVYHGRQQQILKRRQRIKHQTLQQRREAYLQTDYLSG